MNSITFTNGHSYQPSKIICIGRNYLEHIEEMKSQRAAQPIIFLKPNSALCEITKPIPLLQGYGSVHHEIELAVCLGKEGRQISESAAMEYVAGYGLALDLTLRDVQADAKKNGTPWSIAKGFDCSCPISQFVPASTIPDVNNLNLELKVNGETRHNGNTNQMLFKISEIIAFVSRFFTLLPGDLILTGTPSGVGALHSNDVLNARIEHVAELTTRCQ